MEKLKVGDKVYVLRKGYGMDYVNNNIKGKTGVVREVIYPSFYEVTVKYYGEYTFRGRDLRLLEE